MARFNERNSVDLTANNAVDLMFLQITSMDPSPGRSHMIVQFCTKFWAQLSEEYRDLYRQAYVSPERFDDLTEAERLAGEAAYNRGMAKQDRSMMDF